MKVRSFSHSGGYDTAVSKGKRGSRLRDAGLLTPFPIAYNHLELTRGFSRAAQQQPKDTVGSLLGNSATCTALQALTQPQSPMLQSAQ